MDWALFIFINLYGVAGTLFILQARSIKARNSVGVLSQLAVEATFNEFVTRMSIIDDMPSGYEKFKARERLMFEVETLLLKNPVLNQTHSNNIVQLRQTARLP